MDLNVQMVILVFLPIFLVLGILVLYVTLAYFDLMPFNRKILKVLNTLLTAMETYITITFFIGFGALLVYIIHGFLSR